MYTTIVGTKRTPRETHLGKLIRDKRTADNLSLRQAAGVIGIEHSGLSELERGLRQADFETLVKIHEGLGIPLEEVARTAARDRGVDVPEGEEAYKTLALSLAARAESFPDLKKILDRLSTSDPARYRAFLVMFDVWDRQDGQASEDRS